MSDKSLGEVIGLLHGFGTTVTLNQSFSLALNAFPIQKFLREVVGEEGTSFLT